MMEELISHRVYGAYHFIKVHYQTNTHSYKVHWKDGDDEKITTISDDRMSVVTPTNPYHPDIFEGIFIHMHNPNKRKLWIGVLTDIMEFRNRNERHVYDESRIPLEER